MNDNAIVKNLETLELFYERVFDAPRDAVWQAFADADKLAAWWGPRGWETTIKEFEFKPGGVWHYCMKCVDENQGEFFGQESWGKAMFETINAPASFTYTDYFSDADGTINSDMPASKSYLDFEEIEGNKTKVISRSKYESAEDFKQVIAMGVEEGFRQTWDRLDEYVTTNKET